MTDSLLESKPSTDDMVLDPRVTDAKRALPFTPSPTTSPKRRQIAKNPTLFITCERKEIGLDLLEGERDVDWEMHDFTGEMIYFTALSCTKKLRLRLDLTILDPKLEIGFEFDGLRVNHDKGTVVLENDNDSSAQYTLKIKSYELEQI